MPLLSVLDQSPIRAGGTAADAVAETLELAQACERLVALAAEYGAEELVVVTITHDFKARLRFYQLLAEACGLPDGRMLAGE